MHQLSSKILITLVSAITLNGCQLGTKEINSHTKPLKNYSLNYRTVNINAYSNEHVLPNKEARKEKYEKLRKQDLVKDEQLAKYPDRKEILHDLLAKLPTEFLTKLKDFNEKIEFLTSDDDSDKYNQAEFGKDGKFVYFPKDQSNIYVKADIDYGSNSKNRIELYRQMLKVLFDNNQIKFDKQFLAKLTNINTKANGLLGALSNTEEYGENNLDAIENIQADQINSNENQQKISDFFAKIMAQYIDIGAEKNSPFATIASDLDDLEKQIFANDERINIVDQPNKLSSKDKKAITAVQTMIADNIEVSPTALYEQIVIGSNRVITATAINNLTQKINELLKKSIHWDLTTLNSYEIDQRNLTQLTKSLDNYDHLSPELQKLTEEYIKSHYKYEMIDSKYSGDNHIFRDIYPFGYKYISLLEEKIAVCDSFALLNYFALKRSEAFKDDLMFPISITDGHVALLIEHNDHIYIADSWISYLSNESNKIKPYFGDLDSYVDYIYTNFAGKEKSTWLAKTYGGVDSSIVVKETILNTLDGLKDFKGNLGSVFAAKGIQLDSVDQFKIINDYLDRLRLMSPSIQTKY